MGMTIDEAIKIFNTLLAFHNVTCTIDELEEVCKMAIDAMSKYQKIVGIVSLNDEEFKQCGLKELKEILEVIADGNDD
jgi:hypothetical protein